jgi:hypothetical protein
MLSKPLNDKMNFDNLFRPQVLPNRLTGRNYKAFLENNMPDFLTDVPLIIRRELRVMHDGAPAHFSLIARRVPESESFLVGG